MVSYSVVVITSNTLLPLCRILPFILFQQLLVPLLLLSILPLHVLCSYAFTHLPYFAFSFFPSFISVLSLFSFFFGDLQDAVKFLTRYFYPLIPLTSYPCLPSSITLFLISSFLCSPHAASLFFLPPSLSLSHQSFALSFLLSLLCPC